ncbi:MAG TPA: molybdate ABC transporter substrate-binding protein [Thermoanaerobaculia bacterium]
MKKLLCALMLAGCARHEQLHVAAAASLQDALRQIGANYERKTGEHIEFSFGGSNVLMMQIKHGAPVDVFFSADEPTMDKISNLLATREDVLSNELVVVSTKPIADLRSVQRLALGDPAAVPAGVYARQYFERNGTWRELQPKVIPMDNVRAALAAADNGSVDAAVVYRTDAMLAKHAKIVQTLPGVSVRYPVAVLRDSKHIDAGVRFVRYLESPDATAVFKRFGFATLQ